MIAIGDRDDIAFRRYYSRGYIGMVKKYIDLEEIIREENHRLYQKLKSHPLPVFPLLRFLLKENEFNRILNHYPSYDLDFVQEFLKQELRVSWNVHGEKKINKQGRYIFVANHSHGGIDGLLFVAAVNRIFPQIKIMANRVLLKLEKLDGVFLPVSVFSAFTKKQSRQVEDYLNSPYPLLVFPAGVVARKGSGRHKKQLIENRWKKSFLDLAVTYRRDVVPTFIDIENSFWFYFLSKARNRLKIKSNLEMFLLPREIFQKKNRNIDIHYADPIPYQNIIREREKRNTQELADEFQKFVVSRFKTPLSLQG